MGWSWGDEPDSPEERLAADNAIRQFAYLEELVNAASVRFDPDRPEALTPGIICELNRLVVDGLNEGPGVFRSDDVIITGSRHEPPSWADVPALVSDACAYVNLQLGEIHAAAYALWRLNWIHPFNNGNGRTARAVSYLLLCWRAGGLLPGETTIPEMLAERHRFDYNDGLEDADRRWKAGVIDVSMLEALLARLFVEQIGAE